MFVDILNEFSLDQLVDFPTRNTNILDLIISSVPRIYSKVFSLDRFSDHDIVAALIDIHLKFKQPKRKIYLYHKGDYDTMKKKTKEFANDQYFNGCQNSRSVNKNWNLFKSHVLKMTELYIPSKVAKSKLQPPWITSNIRRLVRKRNRTHAKAKKYKSSRLSKRWKNIRAQIKIEAQRAHNDYVNNIIGNIRDNCKPFWRYINSKKQEKQRIPNLKRSDGTEAESDFDKAQCLNAQFSSVYTTKEFDSVPFLKSNYRKMDNISISSGGVQKLLANLKTDKAMGPDEIHPCILKNLDSELSDILCHIFQQSLNTGNLPDDWKEANISPLYKKNDISIPANYRPVSLTCICCKLLEHIITSNLMKHLDNNNILVDNNMHSEEIEVAKLN